MCAARARFKLMLKRCRANESQMKAEAIVNKRSRKNLTSFWRNVKSMSCANNKLAFKVDDASTPVGVADLFRNKFSSVLLEIDDTPGKLELKDKIRVSPYLFAHKHAS